MVRIEFLIGDLEIPRVGLSKVGVVAEVDDFIGKSLIEQGIAKPVAASIVQAEAKPQKKEIMIRESLSMDEK